MVDIAAIAGAIGSIKAAGEIANAMLKLHDAKAFQDKAIELNRIILSAQADAIAANAAQAELVAQIRQFEEEIARLKDWEADKKRYELTELSPGVVALSTKESMRGGEPFHRICADCAANGKKFYLQQHIRSSHFDQFKCKGCGFEIGIDKGEGAAIHQSDYDPFWDEDGNPRR
jgi:hypothetical protein